MDRGRKPFHDWIDAVVIFAALIVAFGLASVFSDWTAGRGIFYYHQQTYEKDRSSEQYCNSGKSLATGDDKASTQGATNSDGNPERENYNACQQWRSAQAAERSAAHAGSQSLASLIGVGFLFLTTGIAFAAMLYAKRAAFETQRSADADVDVIRLTKEFGKIEMRAYGLCSAIKLRHSECVIRHSGGWHEQPGISGTCIAIG